MPRRTANPYATFARGYDHFVKGELESAKRCCKEARKHVDFEEFAYMTLIYAGATAMAKYYEKSKDWTKAQAVYDYTAESSLLNFTSNQKRQLTRKKRSCKRKLEDEEEEAEHVKQMRKASSATTSE